MQDPIIRLGGYELEANYQNLDNAIQEIENGPNRFMSIESGMGTKDEFRMVMEYIEDYGFHVLTLGRGDKTEWVPTEPGVGNDFVEVPIGGAPARIPRRALLGSKTVRRIAGEFLRSGSRTTDVEWIDVDAL